MTMRPGEEASIAATKVDLNLEREAFSDHCRHILDMSPEHLKHSGHKSTEAGLLYSAKEHIKTMNKIIKKHIQKFPD